MRDHRTSQPYFGLVHAFYASMGGFAFYGSYDINGPTVEESPFEIETNPRYTLDIPRFETFIYIMRHFPEIIINVPEQAILDRSESSGLSKALLIIQVTWFCTNCVSRLVQDLSLSLLEVSTAARALCTLAIYFVWWSKPLNVAAPTLLMRKEAQEVYALLKCSDSEYDMAMAMAGKEGDSEAPQGPQASAKIVLAADALRHLSTTERPPPEPRFREQQSKLVPGNIPNRSPSDALFRLKVTAICQIVYAPIYFLAWNSNFTSSRDQLLWRVSSIVVTCSGLVGVCVLFVCIKLNCLSKSRPALHGLALIMVNGIQVIHMLASSTLIVESFWQLGFLDSTAYELPSWTNYWPHIA